MVARVTECGYTQPMRAARHFLLHGKVQAVGFRYFIRDAAYREGVKGWVRNLSDGDVEAFIEGAADAVERMERTIRTGPPGARIMSVCVDTAAPTGACLDFSIT
jgi:acylphosphatase